MTRNPKWDPTLPEKARLAIMAATDDERAEALVHATQFLDTLPFKGRRQFATQSLSWPRVGVFRDDGAPVTGVPEEIKHAASLVAGFILAKVPFGAPALAHVFSLIGHLVEDQDSIGRKNITWH